jgi:hypothetical protein
VDGVLPASDVFDEKLLGRFLALSEVWGSIHAVRWHNLRLYYNPVDRELEPIGFDANLQAHHIDRNLLLENEPICHAFLADPRVRSEFASALQRLTAQVLDGTLIRRWQDREEEYLHILNREYPIRTAIDFDPIIRRAEALQAVSVDALFGFGNALHTAESRYPEVVQARLIRTTAGHYLELANLLPVEASVGEIRVQPENITLPDTLVLEPTPLGGLPARHRVELPLPSGDPLLFSVEGIVSIAGQDRPYRFTAEPYPEAAISPSVPNPTIGETLAGHDLLTFDAASGMFHAGPGDLVIDHPLILPRDTGLRIEAGTTLRFGPDTPVLVRGPVVMNGTADQPVVLKPSGTAEDGWPGILVLGDGAVSSLAWVQIENTTGFRLGGWAMTGGMTFHDSRVDLDHVSFRGTAAEDALNTIRSRFTLNACDFADTRSDAFDGDFSDGTISGGSVERVGGDGIDFSGSDIKVEGTVFREIRDKAVSVGEASTLDANNIRIENAGTGVVSKDRSTTTLRDCTMTGIVHVGMMAYVKKPEYGPAELVADQVTVSGAGETALAQTGSRVVVDGREIPAEDLDVDALYEQGYMKK